MAAKKSLKSEYPCKILKEFEMSLQLFVEFRNTVVYPDDSSVTFN